MKNTVMDTNVISSYDVKQMPLAMACNATKSAANSETSAICRMANCEGTHSKDYFLFYIRHPVHYTFLVVAAWGKIGYKHQFKVLKSTTELLGKQAEKHNRGYSAVYTGTANTKLVLDQLLYLTEDAHVTDREVKKMVEEWCNYNATKVAEQKEIGRASCRERV